MPNIKLSDFPTIENLNGEEFIPLIKSGSNVKSTVNQINNFVNQKIISGNIPTGLQWDTVSYPGTVSIFDIDNGPSVGYYSESPESLFDRFSNARIAPLNTFYANITGNNANPGTSARPVATVAQAAILGNATSGSYKIIADAGMFLRGSITITQDVALIARGGRVVHGTYEKNFSSSLTDSSHPYCYTGSLASAARVMDTITLDEKGYYTDLIPVLSIDKCNITPNSWVLISGILYIHRNDGNSITTANTRIFRTQSNNIRAISNPVSIFIGGETSSDGWDFQGASAGGGINIDFPTLPISGKNAIVCKNSSFVYAGGTTGETNLRSVVFNGVHGIIGLFGCDFSKANIDGINVHNSLSGAESSLLTVNCTAFNNGMGFSTSNNSYTTHENVKCIDVAGFYEYSHGGNIRNISDTKSYFLGTTSKDDVGDYVFGGPVTPTAFMFDDNAKAWLERCKIIQKASTNGIIANGSNVSIYTKDMWPFRNITGGNGNIYNY